MMDFAAIDNFLLKLESARDDDQLRSLFTEFSVDYDQNIPEDPFSSEYRDHQLALYASLAKKEYSINNEVTKFNISEMVQSPFPYCHESFQTVGDTLLAIGFLIKKMALPKGSRILEFGPGWGNTSVELAKTGYEVIAVDIEENFVKLITERAKKEGLQNLKSQRGDFFDIDNFSQGFDAILFFESFHHCSDHQKLLQKCHRVLKPNGKVVFGAEPITPDFPIPWGLRMDGQSIWAIRKNGWLELGFNRDYFELACKRSGFFVDFYDGQDGPWSNVAIATRTSESSSSFTISSGLRTQSGHVENESIVGDDSEGYLIYGPYINLSKGSYDIWINLDSQKNSPIELIFDVVSRNGTLTHSQKRISINKGDSQFNDTFVLDIHANMIEFRLYGNNCVGLTISSVDILRRT